MMISVSAGELHMIFVVDNVPVWGVKLSIVVEFELILLVCPVKIKIVSFQPSSELPLIPSLSLDTMHLLLSTNPPLILMPRAPNHQQANSCHGTDTS